MGAVNLTHTLIETRHSKRRRFYARFMARMLPPVVQLMLGLLPPEGEL